MRLVLDRTFQGLPDTAHGGSVLAAVDAAAGWPGPRRLAGVYRRRVPVATSLQLALEEGDGTTGFELSDGAAVLVDGIVARLDSGAETASVAEDPTAVADHTAGASDATRAGHPLPISTTCFVCGTDNGAGLHAQFAFDDATVAGHWPCREALRGADGGLAPVALTSLLDEAAFWLGALATGESGMTTDLRIVLHHPVLLGSAITVTGARASVRPRADDPRYQVTSVAARDHDGKLVATGEITFVAVRGSARRLVTGLLARNPPAVLKRVFPDYTT
jgi:acyl-coenzyme A thioesterase PaaI-like protein